MEASFPAEGWPKIKLYPVVDHLADKICAMYEWRNANPSSRFRDLADILLISQNETIEAGDARQALHAEAAFRRTREGGVELLLPERFECHTRHGGPATRRRRRTWQACPAAETGTPLRRQLTVS
ncbi:nucleotidyl transferase AbiEii/AbiGii toxin family protein [Streptomyces sp. NPDC015127]|uniref:nucleotidyl transferase AbiEii/AbiGii toxin family protein n=1 Tax=Streptomyces sp. NPDC015127 TaxID=3364939 RepID=UPI0036FC735C